MWSPFPGMDPYLERTENWPGFHSQFIANLASLINELLPSPFVAVVEEPIYVRADTQEISISNSEVRERFIQIVNPRHGDRHGRQVITIIEVLSPTNKRGEGREIYRRKQWEAIQSEVNLLWKIQIGPTIC